MLPIHVAVLHNEHALAMLDGFHHGDPLAHVFSYSALQPELFPTGSDHDVCEQAFMLFNAPEEALTELDRSVAHPYRKRALRSLSVGDVLCVIHPAARRRCAGSPAPPEASRRSTPPPTTGSRVCSPRTSSRTSRPERRPWCS